MSLLTLATLAEFRAWLGVPTGDDAPLLQALRVATAYLERSTHRHYLPYRATRACSLMLHDLGECVLGEDVLELIACVDVSGTVALADLMVLYGGILHHINGQFAFDDTPELAVQVTAIWGVHDRWERAWRSSGDALTLAVSSSTTTLTLSDVDGADSDLRTPRFSVGQLLRLGSEYVAVLAVNTLSNTLTVERAVNGTTAAAYSTGTTVAVYVPSADVVQACLRAAAFFYRQPLEEATEPDLLLPMRLHI